MFLAKFAAMTGRTFIQVILPLRLEWEPFYYVEWEASEYSGTHRWLVNDAEPQAQRPGISVGDRVRVNFAGKEYVGVVSASDAGKEAEALGIVDKVKPIIGMADGLDPVGKEEIELWRQIAEYYLCTVGEVYKAAYPAMKVEEEAVQARREALAVEREEKKRAKIEERIKRLRERIAKKEELVGKAKKAETNDRYIAEKEELEKEVAELVEATKHWKENSDFASTGSATEGVGSAAEGNGSATECVPGSAAEGKGIVLSAAQETAYSKIK